MNNGTSDLSSFKKQLVLPLNPPPKGESCPNNFSGKFKFQSALMGLGYSEQKIIDFLYSPFGGGVRGRSYIIFSIVSKPCFT